jgi:hypothetical protein
MAQPAKSMREKLGDLGPSSLRLKDISRCNRRMARRRSYSLARPGSGRGQTTPELGRDVRQTESGIAASLGDHMDGPCEEGSGRAPNAAIPAASLLHYISRGESHRSTCCYPDLYAGAQGNPRGGHC